MTDEPIDRTSDDLLDEGHDDGLAPLPTEPARPDRGRTWWLVGGAVVLVVALVAGAWAIGSGDDDGGDEASGADGAGTGAAAFWGSRWQLDTGVQDGNQAMTFDGEPIILDATVEGTVSFDGCNGGSTTASLVGDQLSAEPYATTEMACTDDAGEQKMAADALFAALFAAPATVVLEGDALRLTTGSAAATFARLDGEADDGATTTPTDAGDPDDPVSSDDPSLPDPGSGSSIPTTAPSDPGDGVGGGSPGSPGADFLWGQRWELTAVDTGAASGLTTLADGSAPVLDTLTEGQVSFTGCNGGRGQARLEGAVLVVDGLAGTKLACTGAEGTALMAQDAAIASILEGRPTVTFEGDTLVLAAEAGTLEAIPQG